MRYNKDKWQFIKSSIRSKQNLTIHEVNYFKDLLYKILKVGIEFEFNLSKGKKGCDGDSVLCGCVNVTDEYNCWKTCAILSLCRVTHMNNKHYLTCKNFNSENCPNFGNSAKVIANKCKSCNNYEFKCIGIACTNFVPFCTSCPDFKRGCNTCKYKTSVPTPPKARDILTSKLKPTGTYGKVGSGVVSVKTDGSLVGDGGVEIITVGRRVNYWEFYNMTKMILDEVKAIKGYVNERCGAHMHVLAAYYNNINELEKPLPEIVLANLHQLIRKYQNALTWISMALNDPMHLTRWEKFRISLLDVSAVKRTMKNINARLRELANGHKYSFVNYGNSSIKEEMVDIFHIEFREADATMCPSYYAALACLHFAFVIKAVEISRYGLMLIGNNETIAKMKEMKEIILNGADKNYQSDRLSETGKVLDNADYFRGEAHDMLAQMKNILLKLGPAYDVLEKLSDKPVALRRLDGLSWDEIEREIQVQLENEDIIDNKIDEIIDLRLVDDCISPNEWIEAVTKVLDEEGLLTKKEDRNRLEYYIERKSREGDILWVDKLGSYIKI